MRQDNAFVLSYIYFRLDKLFVLRKIKMKTWKVPKTDSYTCKSANILIQSLFGKRFFDLIYQVLK